MAKATTPPQHGESHDQLLKVMLKHINGTVDFQSIAEEMKISTAGAAQKRVKRLLEKIAPDENLLVGSTLGSGTAASPIKGASKYSGDDAKVPATPKAPATPKPRSKRKAKEMDDTEDGSDDVKESSTTTETPSKSVKAEDDAEVDDENQEEKSSSKKKAKVTKPRAPRTPKSPKTPKAKIIKSPKDAKGTKSDAIVIDDAAGAKENTTGSDEEVETEAVNADEEVVQAVATATKSAKPAKGKVKKAIKAVKKDDDATETNGNEDDNEEIAQVKSETETTAIDTTIPGQTLLSHESAHDTDEAQPIVDAVAA